MSEQKRAAASKANPSRAERASPGRTSSRSDGSRSLTPGNQALRGLLAAGPGAWSGGESLAALGGQLGNQALRQLLQSGAARARKPVSDSGDASEREADRIAESMVGCRGSCQKCAAGATCSTCPTCSSNATVQRKPSAPGAAMPNAASVQMLKAELGLGRALDRSDRGFYEARLGVSLDAVRLHTDERAAATADSVGALAYTLGSDVVFARGQYAPHSEAGRRLLAHELVHVAQNARGADGAVVQRQEAPAGATDAPVKDSGPLRPNSDFYVFRGVQMSTDPEYMRGELRRLISRHGVDGGDRWFTALQGGGFDIDLPFSATTTAGGGLRPRTPLDAKRDMDNDARRNKLAPQAIPLALKLYPEIRKEALAFIGTFQGAMEKTLAAVLAESERRLRTQRVQYGLERGANGPHTYFKADDTPDFQAMVGAAQDLLTIRNRIGGLEQKQRALTGSRGKGGAVVPDQHRAEYDRLGGEIKRASAEFERARASATVRHPLLGAVLDDNSDANALGRLAQGERQSGGRGRFTGPPGAAAMMVLAIEEREHNIQTVRAKIKDDPERLWKIPAIVTLTRAVLQTRSRTMADRVIDDHIASLQRVEVIEHLFMAAVGLGLAIASGGTSLLATGAAFAGAGLSGYQMVQSLAQRQLQHALAGTDLDRAQAIASEDPSSFWVAMDVVFFVADGVAALGAVRNLRGLARSALLAKEGTEASEAALKLERAANGVKGAKPGLGQRLLESLRRMRERPGAARVLGDVGEAEAKAVARTGESMAREAAAAETVARVGEHQVKVTRGGHIVVCSDCKWLRQRYVEELAANPDFARRVAAGEARAAAGPLDDAARLEIGALARELEAARRARLGPEALEALSAARKSNFQRRVAEKEIRGAAPATGSRTAGHARSAHGVKPAQQAELLNAPERIFSGIYEKSGREVDIYYKQGSVVITEAGNKSSVITAYGALEADGKAVNPAKWANDPRYVEVKPGPPYEIIYPTRERWERGDFP